MKQVIVVNAELRMPAGKLAAQVAHAAILAYRAAPDDERERWIAEGKTTIVLTAPDAGALASLAARAEALDLPAALVEDAGMTILPAGTVTCLGIGPAEAARVDRVTGALALLQGDAASLE